MLLSTAALRLIYSLMSSPDASVFDGHEKPFILL